MKPGTLDMFAPVAASHEFVRGPSTVDKVKGETPVQLRPAGEESSAAVHVSKDAPAIQNPPRGDEGAGAESGPSGAAASAPDELDVQIVRLTFGITTHAWLCRDCRVERRAAGWTVEPVKATIGVRLSCDSCDCRGQALGGAA